MGVRLKQAVGLAAAVALLGGCSAMHNMMGGESKSGGGGQQVSLSGAIRPVAQTPARLKEAAKLGFARAILPQSGTEASAEAGMALEAVTSLSTLVADIAARGRGGRAAPAPRGAARGLGGRAETG